MKIATLVDLYLDHCKTERQVSGSSLNRYQQRLERFAGEYPLSKIEPGPVNAWLLELVEDVSASTQRHYRKILGGFFNWLVETDRLVKNPINKSSLTACSKEIRIPITKEEHGTLIAYALVHARKYPFFAYACHTGWHTGMRISDVATLQKTAVNWTERGITVMPRKTQRHDKTIEIPLPDFLIEMYRKMVAENPSGSVYICPEMARQFLEDWVKRFENTMSAKFSKFAQEAGVQKTFHCYRHAFVTRLLADNHSPALISLMTGQTVEQVMEYAHLTLDDKRRALKL